MNDRYSTTQIKRTSLSKSLITFYQEMSVCNSCSTTIIAIDARGNRFSIPPVQHTAYCMNSNVTLTRRQTIGKSKEVSGTDAIIDGICVTVDYFEISQSPVYVKEFDLLLCLPEDSECYEHPFRQTSYKNCLELGLQQISQSLDDSPMFKVLANDPTSNYDQLFTLINNQVAKIPVTHMAGDDFELVIITSINGRYQREIINLNEFLTGKENTYEFENRVIPFVTTSELNAREMGKSFRWITMSTVNAILSKKDIEHKEELAALAKKYELKIAELAANISKLDTLVTQLKAERDEIKFKYNSLRGDMSASTDILKEQAEREKTKADQHISDNDVQVSDTKARQAENEAKFKTSHMILAATVPVLALLIIEVIKGLRKN